MVYKNHALITNLSLQKEIVVTSFPFVYSSFPVRFNNERTNSRDQELHGRPKKNIYKVIMLLFIFLSANNKLSNPKCRPLFHDQNIV